MKSNENNNIKEEEYITSYRIKDESEDIILVDKFKRILNIGFLNGCLVISITDNNKTNHFTIDAKITAKAIMDIIEQYAKHKIGKR